VGDIAPPAWVTAGRCARPRSPHEHSGQGSLTPALIAHWKLDEASGLAAADSAGSNPGTRLGDLSGNRSGKIGGALRSTAWMTTSTPFALIRRAGPFSVFAWVKGFGGHAIVSQAGGVHWLWWLGRDMMTELKDRVAAASH